MLNCMIIIAKLNFISKVLRKRFWVVPLKVFYSVFYNEKQAHLKAFVQPDLTQQENDGYSYSRDMTCSRNREKVGMVLSSCR